MYKFVDTTERQEEQILPSEALNFNGVYFENVIPGYRTLYVSGREMIETEITDLDTEIMDGSRYRRKRYKPRTITVGYQLIAKSNAEFRNAYNKLNSLLDAAEAKLIFLDEPDKYYVGTKVNAGDVPHGRNAITAEIEFYCSDPFKYSVEEYEVAPTADDGTTFVVDYKGTYKAHPTFEAVMENGENGFIGFVDQDKHILQIGNIEETDGENYKANETLATLQDFFNAPDDTTGTDYMHPLYGAKGSLGTSTWFNTKFLSLKSAGQQVGRANGGLRTIILPADSTGDQEGCQNFYSYFHILFYAGLMGQTGEMCINYLTADDKLIAGVNWYKSDMSGNTGRYDLVCYNPNKKSTDQQAGRVLKTYTYMTSHLRKQNPWYWNWGHCDLRKEGSKLTFFYNGSYPSFNIPEIADMKCAKIQIAIKQRGTRSGNKYLTYNGINAFYFQKLHVKKWRDVPNKFAQDCSLIANCSDGSIRMNGLPKPDLGALGNDWETFCLKPGVNQVQCLRSGWAKKPTFKMKYREVFL